jgi:hypothetical protein
MKYNRLENGRQNGCFTAVSLKKSVEFLPKACHPDKIVLISDFVTCVTPVSFWVFSDHIAQKTWVNILK